MEAGGGGGREMEAGMEAAGGGREIRNLPEATLRGSSEAAVLPKSCATTVHAFHRQHHCFPKGQPPPFVQSPTGRGPC